MSTLRTQARQRWERQLRFLQARLSPEGYMGLHLTIGMIVIVLTCWCFTEIAEGIHAEGTLALWDARAAEFVQTHATPVMTNVAKIVSLSGSVAFLAVGCVCAAIVFIRKGWFDALLGLVLTMAGGGLLNTLLKHFFARQRPVYDGRLVDLSTFAFPSGHTMGATLFYTFLAAVVAHGLSSRGARALAFACAAAIVVLIGATRIYLGAHFFTDVIGAIVAGLAWLAFCWTAVETLRKWRRRQRARQSEAL